MTKKLTMVCIGVVAVLCFALIIVFVCLKIANSEEQKYEYPSGATSEYYYKEYVALDYNYAFSEIYKNAVDDGNAYNVRGYEHRFYALRDEPIDDYVVCARRAWVFDHDRYVIYASKDSETDLIGKYGVCKMSVFLWEDIGGKIEEAVVYKDSSVVKELGYTESKQLCNFLRENISDKEAFVKLEKFVSGDSGPGETLYCMEEDYLNTELYVRVYIPGHDGIFWESNVVLYEGRYCLAFFHDEERGYYDLIPLSKPVSELIELIISQCGYSFEYQHKTPKQQ